MLPWLHSHCPLCHCSIISKDMLVLLTVLQTSSQQCAYSFGFNQRSAWKHFKMKVDIQQTRGCLVTHHSLCLHVREIRKVNTLHTGTLAFEVFGGGWVKRGNVINLCFFFCSFKKNKILKLNASVNALILTALKIWLGNGLCS